MHNDIIYGSIPIPALCIFSTDTPTQISKALAEHDTLELDNSSTFGQACGDISLAQICEYVYILYNII